MNRINIIKATSSQGYRNQNQHAMFIGSQTSVGSPNDAIQSTHPDQPLDFSASVSSRDYMKIPFEAIDDRLRLGSVNDVGTTFDSRQTEQTPTNKPLRYGDHDEMMPIQEYQNEEEVKGQEEVPVNPLQRTMSFAAATQGEMDGQTSRRSRRNSTNLQENGPNGPALRRQTTISNSQVPDQAGVEVIAIPDSDTATNISPVAADANPNSNNNNARAGQNVRTAQNARTNDLQARLERYAYAQVLYGLHINMIFGATITVLYLMAYLIFKEQFSWHVPFAVFWLTCIVRTVLALRRKNISRMTRKQKKAKYFEAVEWLILAVFLIGATLKLQKIKILLIPFGIVGLLGSFIFPLYYDTCRTFYKKRTLVTSKIIFWIEIALLSLKVDDLFTSWSYVFYPLLFVTFFFVAVSLGYGLVSICYFMRNYGSAHFRLFMIGHLWELLYSLFSWPAAFSVFGLLQLLEGNKNNILFVTLPVGLGHAVFFILYTRFNRKTLTRFQVGPLIAAGRERLEKAKDKQQFESVEETNSYLVKISGTYFVEMPEGFRIRDKQQIEALKEQIKAAKSQGKPLQIDTKKASTQKQLPNNDNNEMVVMDIEPHSADKWKRDRQKIDVRVGIPRPAKPVVVDESSKPIMLDSAKNELIHPIKVSYSMDDAEIRENMKNTAGKKEDEEGDKQCIVCFSTEPNAVIMSCGHGGVCYPCAIEAWKKDDNCLLCRNPITKVLKVSAVEGVDVAKVSISTTKKPLLL